MNVIIAIRALMEFRYLAQAPAITSQMQDRISAALRNFHDHKDAITDSGLRCGQTTGATVSQSVDLGRSNNPNTTPTKDYENVRVVVYLRSVQRGCAEEGERGSTPTG